MNEQKQYVSPETHEDVDTLELENAKVYHLQKDILIKDKTLYSIKSLM